MYHKLLRKRNLISLLLVLALMIVAYAFAAANTVPPTKAGDGQEVISGYTVTNVQYTLNGANPGLIDAVSFTLDSVAVREVQVQLVDGGGWFDCVETAAPNITCSIAGAVTVLQADLLRVVAVQ